MKSGWKVLDCVSFRRRRVRSLPIYWSRDFPGDGTGVESINSSPLTELKHRKSMACEKASERCLSFSRHLSLSPESRASSTRLDVPFSPDGYVPFSPVASSRPHNRMGFSDLNGEVGGHFHWTKHRRRCRTTSETDFGNVVTLPRSYPTRPISPTRNNNPQPVGLVFQSPYNKTGKVL